MAIILEDTDTFQAAADYAGDRVINFGDKIVATFQDLGDSNNINGYVISWTGAAVSVSSKQSLIAFADRQLTRLGSSTSKGIMVWEEFSPDSTRIATVDVSASSLSVNSDVEAYAGANNKVTLGTTTDGSKAVAIIYLSTPTLYAVRCTISGDTITPAAEVEINAAGDNFFPVSIIGLDANRVLMAGHNLTSGEIACMVLDLSSGVSEGALSDTGENSHTGDIYHRNLLTLLDTDKALLAYPLNNDLKVGTVNISSTTISSYGTPTAWYAGSENVRDAALSTIDTETAVVVHVASPVSGNDLIVESVTISGNTVTRSGDDYEYTATAVSTVSFAGGFVVGGGIVLAAFRTSADAGEAVALSGAPITATAAKFYYAINALTERSTLPFGLVNPAGLAVRRSDGKVALGGDGTGTGIVITKGVADNYVADTDVTDSHSTANPVNGVQWVNGS